VRSLWLDEAATLAISSQHGSALWAAMVHDAGNMIAYYALIHVLISVFGDSLVVLRLPSVIAAAVTAGTVSAIGQRLFDRRVGTVGGLLTAVNLPLIYWQQDARAYALVYAVVAVSFLAFIALVEGESGASSDRSRRWAWSVYVAALLLALYMSFVAVFVIPAQLLSLVWYRQRLRAAATAVGVVAVCSVPLAVLAYGRGTGQLFWIPRPNLATAGAAIEWLLGSGMPPEFDLTSTSRPLLVLTALVLAAGGISALWAALRRPKAETNSRAYWAGALLLSWLLVPALLDTAESLLGHSIFQGRYLLISAPAVALALGWSLVSTRLPAWIASAAVAALLVLRMLQIVPTYGASPENWHRAAEYVLSAARPGDCIAFYPADGRMAFDYYFESSHETADRPPRPVLPATPFTQVRPFVEDYSTLNAEQAAGIDRDCPRLWLVSSHVGEPRQSPVSRVHFFRFRTLERRLEAGYRRRAEATFGYAAVVDVVLLSR
jgi:mannosyltransferase